MAFSLFFNPTPLLPYPPFYRPQDITFFCFRSGWVEPVTEKNMACFLFPVLRSVKIVNFELHAAFL